MRNPDPASARARLVEVLVKTGEEDRVAFRELYRLTSAKLFGVCLRICGERQAAEDVLSEVYVTVWRRAGAYEPGRASPISWLAAIARNRTVDWRRANPSRASQPWEDVPELADGSISALGGMLEQESRRRLQLCLDTLDERARGAIRSAFFDGVTYAELATRNDVPLGTMKSWVRRGLLRLKDSLDDDA